MKDNPDSKDYPDFEPKAFGGLKKIERRPLMQTPAPKIQWKADFKSWPMAQRLRYAIKLAEAMNHAADVLQKERNQLLETLVAQEKHIKALQKAKCDDWNMLNGQLTKANERANERAEELHRLRGEMRALRQAHGV